MPYRRARVVWLAAGLMAAIAALGAEPAPKTAETTAKAAEAAKKPAGTSAKDLAEKLSLQCTPLKGARDQIIGAELVGNGHKVILMVGFRMVSVDEKSIWLKEEPRLEDGELFVSDDLLGQLQRLLAPQATPPPVPEQQPVSGRVVLDPGHGGDKVGALGILHHTEEKEVNLSVSLRVAAILRANGIQVTMTRETDRDVDLDERANIANRVRADIFVSIHSNGSENPAESGFMIVYPADDWSNTKGSVNEKSRLAAEQNLAPTGTRLPEAARQALFAAIMQEYCIRSRVGADGISAALSRAVGTTQQGPMSDIRGLRVLRGTLCPAVLVECEFLSNRAGEMRLRSSAFRDKLASAIAEGIMEYLKRHPRKEAG
jgi:N-acetylmuramoyl-L-alanine amidase